MTCITKARLCLSVLRGLIYLVYFFFLGAVFFANNSFFASKRAFDLYGRVFVFFFGLNAIILVMATSI